MNKTIFVTIPMLDPDKLRLIKYRKETNGEIFSEPSRFPSIPMIEGCITGNDNIKIVAIMADDEKGCSKINFETYKKELAELSDNMGVPMQINDVIIIPHDETQAKQIQLFKEVSKHYQENCDIYMDVTYGTKVTSIGLFTSLVYADKVKKCSIQSVIYGKYAHNNKDVGELYDLRALYDLNMLIHAMEFMPTEDINSLIEQFWG